VEILSKESSLVSWINDNKAKFTFKTEDIGKIAIGDLAQDIQSETIYQFNVKYNFQKSEGFYITALAYSKKSEYVVVPHDSYDPSSPLIKIPNLCKKYNIAFKSLIQMLRAKKARFVYKK